MDRRNERGGRNHRPGCLCSFCISVSPAEAVGVDLTVAPPEAADPKRPLELDVATVRVLLGELDERLRDRGVAASVYLVGGAALALAYDRDATTPDVDVAVSTGIVFEEAEALAERHGISRRWLNGNAGGWIPSRPDWSLVEPTRLGLTIHVAPEEHVLAMKLLTGRRKDRPDIRLLIGRCGMADATAEDYADLLVQIYPGEDELANMLGTAHSDTEAARREALLIGADTYELAATLRLDR